MSRCIMSYDAGFSSDRLIIDWFHRDRSCEVIASCPAPKSQHYPQVEGGAAIFLYYLPGGNIRFTGR